MGRFPAEPSSRFRHGSKVPAGSGQAAQRPRVRGIPGAGSSAVQHVRARSAIALPGEATADKSGNRIVFLGLRELMQEVHRASAGLAASSGYRKPGVGLRSGGSNICIPSQVYPRARLGRPRSSEPPARWRPVSRGGSWQGGRGLPVRARGVSGSGTVAAPLGKAGRPVFHGIGVRRQGQAPSIRVHPVAGGTAPGPCWARVSGAPAFSPVS
jgi:hypothetical protein